MQRRRFLKAAAGLGGSILWMPGNHAHAAHDSYFSRLNAMLKEQGPGHPVMLIDIDRMNHNIDAIAGSVGKEKTYRAVVKSLPSVDLLRHVMSRAKTQALMVFHQPFLNAVADNFPDADALLGKPMPVAAAYTFYRKLGKTRFNAAEQVQWLVDTEERIDQYGKMARELGVDLRLNLEIDVGLRRGGFADHEAFARALAQIEGHERLSLSGLMGYEPHLTRYEASLDHAEVQKVLTTYRGYVEQVNATGYDASQLTLNGAGSNTIRIYEKDRLMNDLSAGSGVVMPTDFDTYHLSANKPAVFIAAPILKRYDKNPFFPEPTPDMERVYYIYGGYWKARMVSPPKIAEHVYQSTNQSPVGTSKDVDLAVDDYMFLRPTQSEFVMLQFGDLLAVQDGRIVDRWPVFHQTG